MTGIYDVAVVGAGPAGLAAATTAAGLGRTVVIVDAGARPGGQYWRHRDDREHRGPEGTGHRDRSTFIGLRDALDRGRATGAIDHRTSTQVWFTERGGDDDGWTLHLTPTYGATPDAESVRARRLVLCPGGFDRQLPVPGWDLPGVMAAGGVQALLKEHRSLAGRRVVVAGTGPFLLPVARQLADAGATVVGVCEANGATGWARHARSAAGVPSKVLEGAGYALALGRHRVPFRQRTVIAQIDPDDSGLRVASVRLGRVDRRGEVTTDRGSIDVDLVALGWGFTPSLELVTSVGADTRLDVDESLVAVVDDLQRSSVTGVFVAGEATGVGGASLAVAEGEVAGIGAADAEARQTVRLRTLRRRIARHRAFAAAMHRTHRVPERWHDWLTAGTTICRCEEVDAAAVRSVRDELGALDARTVKLLARPGMGWCQGRVCGYASAKLAAAHEGRSLTADDLRPAAKQTLCAPVTLGHLAASEPAPSGPLGSPPSEPVPPE